jgi:hypothetical protein
MVLRMAWDSANKKMNGSIIPVPRTLEKSRKFSSTSSRTVTALQTSLTLMSWTRILSGKMTRRWPLMMPTLRLRDSLISSQITKLTMLPPIYSFFSVWTLIIWTRSRIMKTWIEWLNTWTKTMEISTSSNTRPQVITLTPLMLWITLGQPSLTTCSPMLKPPTLGGLATFPQDQTPSHMSDPVLTFSMPLHS